MPVLIRDIETRSTLALDDVGAHRYAAHPGTEVLCVAFCVDDGPVQLWLPGQPVPPEFAHAASDPAWTIAAHNDAFETAIERAILGPRFGWPQVPIDRHRCLMAMARAHALPGSLEDVASALKLPEQKDKAGHALMLKMSKPRKPRKGEDASALLWLDDPESLGRLYAYCKQDVATERELMRRLRPLCHREEIVWRIDAAINDRGIMVDRPLLKAADRIIETALEELDREIAELTGGAVTKLTQCARIQAWAAEQGCIIPSMVADKIDELLKGEPPAPVRRALELRRLAAQAAVKKVSAILNWAGPDDRIRGSFQFHKASTGRWSGAGPQLQNLKRSDTDDPLLAAAAINVIASGDYSQAKDFHPNPLEMIGSNVRSMLIAAPGHRFIGGDFKSIEARVLAWLAGEQWKLDAFRAFDACEGPEPYVMTYSRAFNNVAPEAVTAEQRAVGKVMDLALGYAGGVGAFQSMALNYGVVVTDRRADGLKNAWRALHPNIVGLWKRLNMAAIAATRAPGSPAKVGPLTFRRDGDFLFLRLPSSRELCFPYAHLITDKHGNPAVSFKDASGGQWRDCRFGQGAYGGLFTENVVQAIARDLLAEALFRLERDGYPVVLHCHDEAVVEVPIGTGSLAEFHDIMTKAPSWADGLPIAAECWEGGRYGYEPPDTEGPGVPANDDAPIERILAELGGLPQGHFRCIVIDPPWKPVQGEKGRPLHYARLKAADLKRLGEAIEGLAHPEGCWVFMWCKNQMLSIALRMAEDDWRLKFSSVFLYWNKVRMGMGKTSRRQVELLLLFKVKRSPGIAAHDVSEHLEYVEELAREHSRKPDESFARIERFCAGPRLEIFSRQSREGWAAFGDQKGLFDAVAAAAE